MQRQGLMRQSFLFVMLVFLQHQVLLLERQSSLQHQLLPFEHQGFSFLSVRAPPCMSLALPSLQSVRFLFLVGRQVFHCRALALSSLQSVYSSFLRSLGLPFWSASSSLVGCQLSLLKSLGLLLSSSLCQGSSLFRLLVRAPPQFAFLLGLLPIEFRQDSLALGLGFWVETLILQRFTFLLHRKLRQDQESPFVLNARSPRRDLAQIFLPQGFRVNPRSATCHFQDSSETMLVFPQV